MKRSEELKSEYDLSTLGEAVIGKYAPRLGQRTFELTLKDELAAEFPNSRAVIRALKKYLALCRDSSRQGSRALPKGAAVPSTGRASVIKEKSAPVRRRTTQRKG